MYIYIYTSTCICIYIHIFDERGYVYSRDTEFFFRNLGLFCKDHKSISCSTILRGVKRYAYICTYIYIYIHTTYVMHTYVYTYIHAYI